MEKFGIDPSLISMLPAKLMTRFKGGWGKFVSRGDKDPKEEEKSMGASEDPLLSAAPEAAKFVTLKDNSQALLVDRGTRLKVTSSFSFGFFAELNSHISWRFRYRSICSLFLMELGRTLMKMAALQGINGEMRQCACGTVDEEGLTKSTSTPLPWT
jgi:hypothetical protein